MIKKHKASWPDKVLRRKAEKVLLKNQSELRTDDLIILERVNNQEILHELQVHQIELEMQNEELHIIQRRLESNRKKYFSLFENAPVGYIVCGENGRLIEVNQTASSLLSVSRNELLGTALSKHIFSEDQDSFYLARKALKKSGDSQTCELRLVCKNSSFIWVQLNILLLKSTGWLERIAITDISAFKQMELDLLESVKLSDSANRAKSIFLSNVTHDLRTPLNSIMGMAEVLKDNNLEDKMKQFSLAQLTKSGDTLLQIIEDLLDLAKMESGGMILDKRVFDIQDLIKSVLEIFSPSCEEKGIELYVDIDSDVPRFIWEDEHCLHRVLSNLVSNAVKFTNSGAISIFIENSNNTIVFSVKDTGIGIEPKYLTEIMQPFTQEDSSITREFGGSGLGISIVESFRKLMNGKFWIRSKKGIGSTFYFSIPIVSIPENSKKISIVKPPKVAKIKLLPLKVLLVDDSPDNCVLVKLFLQNQPVELDMVSDGLEAVNIYKANNEKYDVILMDLQMPVLSGYEAAKAIREWEESEKHSNVIIVALSASVMEEEIRNAISCGCNLHMSKPVKKHTVLELLNDVSLIKYNQNLTAWNSSLSVGNTQLDLEHQKVFSSLSDLCQAIGYETDSNVILQLIEKIMIFMGEHFNSEEELFMSSAYPDKDKHQAEHRVLRENIQELRKKIYDGEASPAHFILLLKTWLSEHIYRYDQSFSYYI